MSSKDKNRKELLKYVGTVYINEKYFWDYPEVVKEVLEDCLILECNFDYSMLSFVYKLINEKLFDERDPSCIAPIYDPIFEETLEMVGESSFKLNVEFKGYEKRKTH